MRQVHQIHDAEHECQPGRQQEQQQAELKPVQALLDEKRHNTPIADIGRPISKRRQRSMRRRRHATAQNYFIWH